MVIGSGLLNERGGLFSDITDRASNFSLFEKVEREMGREGSQVFHYIEEYYYYYYSTATPGDGDKVVVLVTGTVLQLQNSI